MNSSQDPKPLKGVARSLDDLFSQAGEASPEPAAPPVPTAAPPAADTRTSAAPASAAGAVLVEEAPAPSVTPQKTDPGEERRQRVRIAKDALDQAVDSLLSG